MNMSLEGVVAPTSISNAAANIRQIQEHYCNRFHILIFAST
jgi:hypothetical protein